MYEYAFDVKMAAVIRVRAHTLEEAKTLLGELEDEHDINRELEPRCHLTSASVTNSAYAHMFEILDVINNNKVIWEEINATKR